MEPIEIEDVAGQRRRAGRVIARARASTLALWAGLAAPRGVRCRAALAARAARRRRRARRSRSRSGRPASLTFWAPNRGLLAVEGNSVVPRGILAWDGESWHTLATVCGGPGDTMRIAWAGPTEFWTVSEPSRPRQGSGTALCRFKDGVVVGSYSTADNAADPYRQMNAAACRAADDCWFGGIGSRDPTGTRVGAFHLHWDGAALRTVYNARSGARGERHRGRRRRATSRPSSSARGAARGSARPAAAGVASRGCCTGSRGGVVRRRPVRARASRPRAGASCWRSTPPAGSAWAVGGGAASGPAVAARGVDGVIARPPLAAVAAGRDAFRELALTGRDVRRPPIASRTSRPCPGGAAWAALVPYAERGRTNAKAQVARIDGATGAVEVESLPAAGLRARGGRADRVHLGERRLAGHQRGLAVPLLRRAPPGARHRPGVRRADHDAPERGRRAVRARHRARRRLAAVRAAAGGARDRARRGARARAAGGADHGRAQAEAAAVSR